MSDDIGNNVEGQLTVDDLLQFRDGLALQLAETRMESDVGVPVVLVFGFEVDDVRDPWLVLRHHGQLVFKFGQWRRSVGVPFIAIIRVGDRSNECCLQQVWRLLGEHITPSSHACHQKERWPGDGRQPHPQCQSPCVVVQRMALPPDIFDRGMADTRVITPIPHLGVQLKVCATRQRLGRGMTISPHT